MCSCQQPGSIFLMTSPQVPARLLFSPLKPTISPPSWEAPVPSASPHWESAPAPSPSWWPSSRSMLFLYSCGLIQEESEAYCWAYSQLFFDSLNDVKQHSADCTKIMKQCDWVASVYNVFPSWLKFLNTFLHSLDSLKFSYSFKNQNRFNVAALYFVDLLIFQWFANSGFQSPSSKKWLNSGSLLPEGSIIF